MDKWVKNLIGICISAVILIFGWRLTTSTESSFKFSQGEITIKNSETISPTTAERESNSKIDETRKELEKVEVVKTQEWSIESGWHRGGASREQYCEQQRILRVNQYPNRTVKLTNAVTSHKSEYTPFKHDYYNHLCTYRDEWVEPETVQL